MNYLDPEEEFEMIHADEFEIMNEMDLENDGNSNYKKNKNNEMLIN